MRYLRLVVVVLCLLPASIFSQSDSVLRIALILGFQGNQTSGKLNDYLQSTDVFTANKIRIDDDALLSLDFYEGALQALQEHKDELRIEWSVYDNDNNDSLTEVILKQPGLKQQDIIIGSVSTSSARLVAAFCKENKILNIQPFTPSKSLTTENAYHVKLAPTIDAHVDAMFHSILDSFPGANIIIHTPDAESNLAIAGRLDSLFQRYNQTAEKKFKVAKLSAGSMKINGAKTTVSEQLSKDRLNILVLTSFEESFVNGSLRVLYEERANYPIIVYGMPTWLSGDILRFDYLNDYSARISDLFFADTTKSITRKFKEDYKLLFLHEPSRFSYLGYDVLNFLLNSFQEYGINFPEQIYTQVYSGCGYKFELVKTKSQNGTVDYYENRHVNIFRVDNYRLRKIW